MRENFKLLCRLVVPMLGLSCLRADVRLPALFSDHMVLQKAAQVPVWGKASPGEKVSINLDSLTAHTVADAAGRWSLTLGLSRCGPGPFEMVVAGKNRLVIADVMVGEVWLASGQSNMAFLLESDKNAASEIPASSNVLLREFRSERRASSRPAENCPGKWIVAKPSTTGQFSAVGYYFGKNIQSTLHVPVGVVHASWGGTFSESWTSLEALNTVDELKRGNEERLKFMSGYPERKKSYARDMEAWLKETKREDPDSPHPELFAGTEVATTDWTPVRLPGAVSGKGLPATGVIWIRREVNISSDIVKSGQIKMMLGRFEGFDATWWNGEKIAETSWRNYPGDHHQRYFTIPRHLVKEGRNVIAVRLFAPIRRPRFLIEPARLRVGPLPLQGEWLAKAEFAFENPDATEMASAPGSIPPPLVGAAGGALFNGMIHPLLPYSLAGVIWYQGESNRNRAWQYRTAFPLLINDWRQQWKNPELPFYFCQLANFGPRQNTPSESAWAELREAQSLALALPNTGQAVLVDTGESDDIHPRDKETVGHRLATIALARHYQKEIPYSGPVYQNYVVEKDRIRLTFTHAGSGLIARPVPQTFEVKSILGRTAPLERNSPHSELEGFAICGDDHRWVWADARIEGQTVLVWSAKAPNPVAVRYAWADNPTCNLYNGDGLPASPFRTDDFPLSTVNSRY
ncbi:protein of unknown function (DUF303) [Opitutaceae bacterium TAV1]|nr:protein of unknown function (DUF303) [Opitutaceae bacterium TAV1]